LNNSADKLDTIGDLKQVAETMATIQRPATVLEEVNNKDTSREDMMTTKVNLMFNLNGLTESTGSLDLGHNENVLEQQTLFIKQSTSPGKRKKRRQESSGILLPFENFVYRPENSDSPVD
jgi:hypothetical protein